ncbi:MAG TPA: DUF3857 domain-containing protein [Gammaproteobacteria bacterium]|nr:DUF3857 domain-containing protein [Gammaproteobacteria bacterium]
MTNLRDLMCKDDRNLLGIVSVLLLVTLPALVMADDSEPADLNMRYVRYHIDQTVNDDLTHVQRIEVAKKVLKERAIKRIKKTTISFSTSIQHAEVLEAYTLKQDGRRIDAPKTNFQVRINKGAKENAPVFSDRTTLTVVFPEVEVGDTVVFYYQLTQTEPMFPGQFSASSWFSRAQAYDDVYIRLDVPESLRAHYQTRQMTEKVTTKNGRRILEWRFKNSDPKKNERQDYSVWDSESEPGFAFSTFESYQQIAETYGLRATPKAEVTERVSKLAAEIVGDETDTREQARLLYEWVATKISYAGNCIGVGAVVPHDIFFILDNRMGDCKDHATVLQALLSAKGIRSTQALVNSGRVYKLQKVPMVSSVNHVINYLPDYDLFVDSTSTDTPFGLLPFSVSDKPVLLVDGYQENMKTPATSPAVHQQRMKSVVNIVSDGSATGEIELNLDGMSAANTRKGFRHITADQEEKWLEKVFRSEGYLGSGSIEKDDPSPLHGPYGMKVTFEKKSFIHRPGAGAFRIGPLLPSDAPIQDYITSMVEPVEDVDTACSGGKSVEEYSYVLPHDMELLAKPEDMAIEGAYIKYTATYKVEGNTLKVVRVLEDQTPGNVCSPKLVEAQRALGLQIIKNLNSQAVYK